MHITRGVSNKGALNQLWNTWKMIEAMKWLKTFEFKISCSYECAIVKPYKTILLRPREIIILVKLLIYQ